MTSPTSSPGRFQSASSDPGRCPRSDSSRRRHSSHSRERSARDREPGPQRCARLDCSEGVTRRRRRSRANRTGPGTTRRVAAKRARWEMRAFIMCGVHLLSLETEVLERLCGAAVDVGGFAVVTTTRREVAQGDPRGCAMADRRELFERRVGGAELAASASSSRSCSSSERPRTSWALPISSRKSTRPSSSCSAWRDCSSACSRVTGAQMDLRERRHGLRRVGVVPEIEGDAERFLQVRDCLVGLPEREVQAADVVVQPAEVTTLREISRRSTWPARRTCARAPSGPRARRARRPGSRRSPSAERSSTPQASSSERSTSSFAASKSRWRR